MKHLDELVTTTPTSKEISSQLFENHGNSHL